MLERTSRQLSRTGDPIWNLRLESPGEPALNFEAVTGRAHRQDADRHIAGTRAPLPLSLQPWSGGASALRIPVSWVRSGSGSSRCSARTGPPRHPPRPERQSQCQQRHTRLRRLDPPQRHVEAGRSDPTPQRSGPGGERLMFSGWGLTWGGWLDNRKGEWWLLAQLILIAAHLLPPWPAPASWGLAIWPRPLFGLGVLILLAGCTLAGQGFLALGSSLSPLPAPRDDNRLITEGPYRRCRHPLSVGPGLLAGCRDCPGGFSTCCC